MKTYAILFAMNDEANSLIKNLNAILIEKNFFEIYQKENIYIVISNVGLINAATCFTYVNQKYQIDFFINCGLVGTINNNLKQLQPIVIEKSFLGNVDATGFGYKLGQVPKMPCNYFSDKDLLNKFSNFKKINICSSDTFINSFEKFNQIIKPIDETIEVFDMECFGYYQAAYIFNKPIVAIKIISDVLGNQSNEEQFLQILKLGSQRISNIVIEFLNSLEEKNNAK